jgi:ABC-type sugar transport system permease subunit
MTTGGPLDATRTIVYVIYERAFRDFMGGYASALAVILFIIIMIVSMFQLRMYRQNWEY